MILGMIYYVARVSSQDKVRRKNGLKALYDKISLVFPNQFFWKLKWYGGNCDDGCSFSNPFIPEQKIVQGSKLVQ